jgi:hypothetical protein
MVMLRKSDPRCQKNAQLDAERRVATAKTSQSVTCD